LGRSHVYILECADGEFYTGVTNSLKLRLAQHEMGHDPSSFTFGRRPVKLVWTASFPTEQQARERERQIKGWSRAKKRALIHGGPDAVHDTIRAEQKRAARPRLAKKGTAP
jgi:predicted GIY-YIG superfamily endonuclease